MEEKKEQKKLSYEELSKAASELHVQYQKLMAEYQKAIAALQDRNFNYTSFFLQMLFNVIQHKDAYKQEFVDWCIANIEGALTTFADSMKDTETAEKKDETE